jgi:hypothetical protein
MSWRKASHFVARKKKKTGGGTGTSVVPLKAMTSVVTIGSNQGKKGTQERSELFLTTEPDFICLHMKYLMKKKLRTNMSLH